MLEKYDSVVILAPHADDEILGCGCLMKHAYELGVPVHIVFFAIGEYFSHSLGRNVGVEEREEEARNAIYHLHPNAIFEVLTNKEATLDTIPIVELITKIDELLGGLQPTVVMYNHASHHQDHQVSYKASVAALRPNSCFTPRLQAVYEYPPLQVYSPYGVPQSGKIYLNAQNHIHDKVDAFKKYKSQIQRELKDPLHPNNIVTLASLRGKECRLDYAETYYMTSMISNGDSK